MSDRPTLKSLSERLDSVTSQVGAVKVPDVEARAISRCVHALNDLPKTSGGTTYTYDRQQVTDLGAIDRVLNYLRQRYNLPDPQTELRRLAAEVEPLRQRCYDLEHRLNTVRGAADTTAVTL